MESFVKFVQHQPCQFYSLQCCNGKTSSTRIRRRTCHSQITTYDEFDRKNAFVSFSTLSNPGRTSHTNYSTQESNRAGLLTTGRPRNFFLIRTKSSTWSRNNSSQRNRGTRKNRRNTCVTDREELHISSLKSSQNHKNFDGIEGEPTEFEWNIFQRFDTLYLCDKNQKFPQQNGSICVC